MYGLYQIEFLDSRYRILATLGQSQVVIDSDVELARFIGKSLDYLLKYYSNIKLLQLTYYNCLELL